MRIFVLMGMITSRYKNMLHYILLSYWYVTKELGGGTKETDFTYQQKGNGNRTQQESQK